MAEQEQLSAAQRGKIRRLSAPRELAPDEEGGELNIVPFLDIITNVLMFVLATVSVTFTATIDTSPPSRGGRSRANPPPSLGLTVIVVPDGFSVKAKGGSIAPGCHDIGSGITIPRSGNDYDYKALNTCVGTIKREAPEEVRDETNVTISANPNIPYQVVVSTIDAVRKDDNGQELFPDVQFGLSR
ncbi:MAG TPA: biopolymer transporter ExbD [Polyangiaceae bacterium]|jgi:biopolymer transport protein ExbD